MQKYSSADAGAPQLTITSHGTMNAVLKAVLVDGYGSRAGAGWTAAFTGANLLALQQGAGGNGRILRCFDGSYDASTMRRIYLRGYESMTAISTGTGPFPTTGQLTGNGASALYGYLNAADTPAVAWECYATSSFFHMFISWVGGGVTTYREWFGFGTFESLKPGDTYADVLLAGRAQNDQSGHVGVYSQGQTFADSPMGIYIARSDTGAAGAKFGLYVAAHNANASYFGGSSSYPLPTRVDNALVMSRPEVWCDGQQRGYIPGIWDTGCPATDLNEGDTWSGKTGSPISGLSFKIMKGIGRWSVGATSVAVETSNTW